MNIIFYYLHSILGVLLQVLFFKTKIYYEDDTKQNRRLKTGSVIITNHRSFLDGIVLGLKYVFNRLFFISQYFYKDRLKIVEIIVRLAGGIFVDKDVYDFEFIEKSKSIIAKKRSIIIFPEGGFQFSFEPARFQTGYILLAIKTGAKIVPIANDFNYGLFKRTHLMIGNSIDLSEYADTELTTAKRREINKKIHDDFMLLYYRLKKRKAEKFKFKYEAVSASVSLQPGAVIRIPSGNLAGNPANSAHHYGVYLNDNEVIHFDCAAGKAEEDTVIASVSLNEFCGGKTPEVRIVKKRFTRKFEDIEKYAISCIGFGRYSAEKNNCLDFANRITLNI